MSTATAPAASSPRHAAVPWIAAFTASIVASALLHGLGRAEPFAIDWSHLWTWLGTHSPERVLMATARLVALGLAYWVAGSLVASTAARASGIPRLIRSIDGITLPAVRRIAERTVALSLAASTFAGTGTGMVIAGPLLPADTPHSVVREAESAPTPHYVPVPAGDPDPAGDEDHTQPSYVPTPAGAPQPLPVAPASVGSAAGTEASDPASSPAIVSEVAPRRFDPAAADVIRSPLRRAGARSDYTVVPGDNLWRISEKHLAGVLERRPSEGETATYWAHLVATNRPHLRSGNPDLIYPGEVVVCPATTDVGIGG